MTGRLSPTAAFLGACRVKPIEASIDLVPPRLPRLSVRCPVDPHCAPPAPSCRTIAAKCASPARPESPHLVAVTMPRLPCHRGPSSSSDALVPLACVASPRTPYLGRRPHLPHLTYRCTTDPGHELPRPPNLSHRASSPWPCLARQAYRAVEARPRHPSPPNLSSGAKPPAPDLRCPLKPCRELKSEPSLPCRSLVANGAGPYLPCRWRAFTMPKGHRQSVLPFPLAPPSL
jgi:hypothetical protein